MNKTRLITLLSLLAITMTGCSFEFTYDVPLYPGSLNGELGYEDTGVDDDGFSGKITVWCDETIKSGTTQMISTFQAKNPQFNFTFEINATGEDKAASSMIENVRAGADIYVFAEDQLNRLKTAGALGQVPTAMKDAIVKESTPESVNAGSINGKLFAFPFTADNGYFMYYDKSIFPTEDSISSIEGIMETLKSKGKKISYPVFSNGWYSTSYFMATGCDNQWVINAKNQFVDVEDTYNSENGFIACKGLRQLRAYESLFSTKDVKDMKNETKVVISGVWDYAGALETLGDNLGCAKMPTFTVDGETRNISSYMGHKLVGVRPSSDEKRQSVCMKIARYISNETSQLDRFYDVSWGPTNKNAANAPKVLEHQGLAALNAQKPYAKAQSPTPENWFSNVMSLATSVTSSSTDADLWAALAAYEKNNATFLD